MAEETEVVILVEMAAEISKQGDAYGHDLLRLFFIPSAYLDSE